MPLWSSGSAVGGPGGALGEVWGGLEEVGGALQEIWEAQYIEKHPINRTSGRYVTNIYARGKAHCHVRFC